MMWSFNLGTGGGWGRFPGLMRCVCMKVCVCVGGWVGEREGTRTGVFGVSAKGHEWQTQPSLPAVPVGPGGHGLKTPGGPSPWAAGRAASWLPVPPPAVVSPAPEGHRSEVLACSFGNGKEGREGRGSGGGEERGGDGWHEGSGMLLSGCLCRCCLCLGSLGLLRRGVRFGEIHLQDVPL